MSDLGADFYISPESPFSKQKLKKNSRASLDWGGTQTGEVGEGAHDESWFGEGSHPLLLSWDPSNPFQTEKENTKLFHTIPLVNLVRMALWQLLSHSPARGLTWKCSLMSWKQKANWRKSCRHFDGPGSCSGLSGHSAAMGRKAFCDWAAPLNQCLPSTRQIPGNVETMEDLSASRAGLFLTVHSN